MIEWSDNVINANLYEDKPYIPSRDPREVNQVEHLKKIQELQKLPQKSVNDEDIQQADLDIQTRKLASQLNDQDRYVKLNEDGVIDPKYLPSSYVPDSAAMYTAATHFEFPTVGESDILYLATEENNHKGYIYRWCDENNCYEKPYDALENISIIYGGNADS